jgi:hypothetical protein
MNQAANILWALGGVANIIIEPCTARLRSEGRDPGLVDVAALRAGGAHAVMIMTISGSADERLAASAHPAAAALVALAGVVGRLAITCAEV